jgi:hypothetical protein
MPRTASTAACGSRARAKLACLLENDFPSQVHSSISTLARLTPLDTHLVAARRAARRTRDVNAKRIA